MVLFFRIDEDEYLPTSWNMKLKHDSCEFAYFEEKLNFFIVLSKHSFEELSFKIFACKIIKKLPVQYRRYNYLFVIISDIQNLFMHFSFDFSIVHNFYYFIF